MKNEGLYYLWPRGLNWQTQRRAALVRDKYTCQRCGDKTRKGLHVHHIKPFRTFATSKGANRLPNLVTLCPKCHRVAEKEAKAKNYKTHKDFLPAAPFHGGAWPKARKAALARDKNTCQVCGLQKNTGLHVHHIIPGYAFKYDDLPPSAKHNLNNLVTLCKDCHAETERYTKVAFPPYPAWESHYGLDKTFDVTPEKYPGARCPAWSKDWDHFRLAKLSEKKDSEFVRQIEAEKAEQHERMLAVLDRKKKERLSRAKLK